MCGGRPPMDRMTSTSSAARASIANNAGARSTTARARVMSVRGEGSNRFQDIGCAWQDHFFEHRRIGDRAVERRHAGDRRIEVFEQLLRDPRGNLGAEPARQLVLMD